MPSKRELHQLDRRYHDGHSACPQAVPRNWPASIKYLRRPSYSAGLDSTTRRLISSTPHTPPTAISFTLIKIIRDPPTHPALGQFGLFATKKFEPGDFILDYMGIYHAATTADTDPTSDYDLSLRHGSDLHIGIDACKAGNEARMTNDYRGVKSAPNARFDSYVTPTGEIRMGIFVIGSRDALKRRGGAHDGIKKGHEILVSYGKSFWQSRATGDDAVLQ